MAEKKARFTAESKLGFMRVIQVVNVLDILVGFMALIFISGRDLRGVDAYLSFNMALNTVCMGELIWLIWHRKRHTRQIAIGMYALTTLSTWVMYALMGTPVSYTHLTLPTKRIV